MRIKIYTHLGKELIVDCNDMVLQNRGGVGKHISTYNVDLENDDYVIGTTILEDDEDN